LSEAHFMPEVRGTERDPEICDEDFAEKGTDQFRRTHGCIHQRPTRWTYRHGMHEM
jgi:hypothetical protein